MSARGIGDDAREQKLGPRQETYGGPVIARQNAPARTAPDVATRGRRWSGVARYTAVVWSLLYGALGFFWWFGNAGFPFGRENDPQAALSILADVDAETGAPIVAGLGVVASAVAIAMARGWERGAVRLAMLAFAWVLAAILALVLPDYRLLMAVAYLPLFVVGAPFGWPPGSFFDVITWPAVNQVICVIGGVCWAAAAVDYQRRSTAAGAVDGRDARADWTTPAAAARWGRWATAVAVVIPLLYAATRWVWALGIPLGISEELLREGQAVGLWWAGAGLATVAVAGALLTLGLVQRWGECFPGWLPVIGGERVPPALAIVPAGLVAVLVTTAGLMYVRLTLFGDVSRVFSFLSDDDWAALAPELLWPLWGVALALATLAYGFRRRDERVRCGG